MCKPGLMAYVWNPSTWQADAGGLQAIERLFKNKKKSAWTLPALRLVSLTMSSWFARLSPLTLNP